jgi:hypothetical protein
MRQDVGYIYLSAKQTFWIKKSKKLYNLERMKWKQDHTIILWIKLFPKNFNTPIFFDEISRGGPYPYFLYIKKNIYMLQGPSPVGDSHEGPQKTGGNPA